jgi:TonB family protein
LKLKMKISQILEDNPDLKRKGFCLLGSVAIHAIFIILCFIFIVPIRVFVYEEKITDVIIVPPEQLFIPEIDKYPSSISELKEGLPGTGLEERSQFPEEGGKIQVDIDQGVTGIGEPTGDRAEKTAPHPGLTSGFSLDIPSRSRSKSDLPSKDQLFLPLGSDKKEKIIKEIGKAYEKKDLNFLKYVYSGYSNTGPSRRTDSRQSSRRGTSIRKGSASFKVQGYDISPWARIVVDKIQKNWILSPSQKTSATGEVEIFVTIEKSGELSSVEITKSSEIELLDQAALDALNMSSPFPKLPDDFPNKSLEAYFVFSYHD